MSINEEDLVPLTKKNFELAHKTGVDAEFAAEKIIRAIEKNKKRIKIGKDAYIFHFIMRFFPDLGSLVMKKLAQKLAS